MRKAPFFIILLAFLVNCLGPLPLAQAQEFRLPAPGVRVNLSPEFNPPILKGLKVHPDNPFRFDFILDQGDSVISASPTVIPAKAGIQQEATKLIKYFLASLTIPEKDLWVNLSPYEKDRIIPQSFGLTEMGRDLLAEDYMLKQITASLIYPEDEIGKKFWKRIYEEAAKQFGTTNIPVNTFNKVWIVPEKAVVYENAKAGTAYVVESKLKVMLEQDYLSMQKHSVIPAPSSVIPASSTVIPAKAGIQDTSSLGSQIIREIVIPQLTKEVNEGKNFSQLRQVYNSLILATWYKKKIKDSILSQVYADKNKVAGVGYDKFLSSPNVLIGDPEHIYQQYLKAFKKGVYNYIKEEPDPMTQATISRKYFSGGTTFNNAAMAPALRFTKDAAVFSQPESDRAQVVEVKLGQVAENRAMTVEEKEATLFLDTLIGLAEHGGRFGRTHWNRFPFLSLIKMNLEKKGPIDPTVLKEFDNLIGFFEGFQEEGMTYPGFVERMQNIRDTIWAFLKANAQDTSPAFSQEMDGFYKQFFEALEEANTKIEEVKKLINKEGIKENSNGYYDGIAGSINYIQPSLRFMLDLMAQKPIETEEIDLGHLFDGFGWDYKHAGKEWVDYPIQINRPVHRLMVKINQNMVRIAIERIIENAQDALNKSNIDEKYKFIRISFHETEGGYKIVVTNSGKLPDDTFKVEPIILSNGQITRPNMFITNLNRGSMNEGSIGTNVLRYAIIKNGGDVSFSNTTQEMGENIPIDVVRFEIFLPHSPKISAKSGNSAQLASKEDRAMILTDDDIIKNTFNQMILRHSDWLVPLGSNPKLTMESETSGSSGSTFFNTNIKGIFSLGEGEMERRVFRYALTIDYSTHEVRGPRLNFYEQGYVSRNDLRLMGIFLMFIHQLGNPKIEFLRLSDRSDKATAKPLLEKILKKWSGPQEIQLDRKSASYTIDLTLLDYSKIEDYLGAKTGGSPQLGKGDVAMQSSRIKLGFMRLEKLSEDTGADVRPYVKSNEKQYSEVIETLRSHNHKGGVHIGVSGLQNLDIMAARQSEWGIIIDINKRTGEIYSLIKEIFENDPEIKKEVFSKKLLTILSEGRLDEPWYFLYNATAQNIVRQFFNEKGSWLTDDKRYEHIKKMFLDNRIIYIQGNMANRTIFEAINRWIRQSGLNLDTLYISNIVEWGSRTNPFDLYRNVISISDNQTLILESPDLVLKIRKVENYSSPAMLHSVGIQKEGGIDLTPANMNLQTKIGSPTGTFGDDRQGIKFHLDSAMLQQLQNAPGFVPVIISVQPLKDLKLFLGVDDLD